MLTVALGVVARPAGLLLAKKFTKFIEKGAISKMVKKTLKKLHDHESIPEEDKARIAEIDAKKFMKKLPESIFIIKRESFIEVLLPCVDH